MRQEFTKATKAQAFQRAGGRCECGCGAKLTPGEVEYDHIIEAALGGDNSLDNCRVMRVKCHRHKTGGRRFEMDKSRRTSEKAMGLRKGRPMAGSRASGWKKKMDGSVERR